MTNEFSRLDLSSARANRSKTKWLNDNNLTNAVTVGIAKHRILLLFFLIAMITAYVMFFQNKQSLSDSGLTQVQKEEALKNLLGRKAQAKEETVSTQWEDYISKYFSLSYPGWAKIYNKDNSNIKSNKSVLEFFRFDMEFPRITFIAQVLDGSKINKITDSSPVMLRRTQSDVYTEAPVKVSGRDGLIYSRNKDGFERSAFFLIDGKEYSFVLSGANSPESSDIFNKIISQLKFI
jgi:hypothetical protein